MPNEEGNLVAGDKGSAGDVQKLQSQLGDLQKQQEELKGAKDSLERKLEEADKELLSPEYLEFLENKRAGGDKGKGKVEQVDFDDMTPGQIAKYYEDKAKGNLDKAVTDITKRMDTIDENIGKIVGQIDLTITGIKHRDFGETLDTPPQQRTQEQKLLIDTVYRIATENPTWGAEKCLRQSKLEMKARQEELDTVEKAKAEKERKALTEKGGVSSFTVQGKTPSKHEAADAAWKSTFGNKERVD